MIKLWWRFVVLFMVLGVFINKIGAMEEVSVEEEKSLAVVASGTKRAIGYAGATGVTGATGPSVDQQLWYGVKHGNKNMVQEALQKGAYVEGSFIEGIPLDHATGYGHIEIVKMLVLASSWSTVTTWKYRWKGRDIQPGIREAIASMVSVKIELGQQDWLLENVSFVYSWPSVIEQIICGYADFNGDKSIKEFIISQIKRNEIVNTLKENRRTHWYCVCQ